MHTKRCCAKNDKSDKKKESNPCTTTAVTDGLTAIHPSFELYPVRPVSMPAFEVLTAAMASPPVSLSVCARSSETWLAGSVRIT